MTITFITVRPMKHLLLAASSLAFLAAACAGSPPPASNTPASTETVTAQEGRPSCDAIDEACDPHEDAGGLAKECHDLAEAKTTTEAACAARKAECLAACPKK